MTTHNGRPDVKDKVKERYARIALVDNSDCCCMPGECGTETQTYFSSASEAALAIGYDENELKSVPAASILGVGCGAPLNFAGISEGEVVVDLGSGAGIDVFLSANRVGKGGKVIGIDMTDEMLEKARKNAKDHGYANVEFRKGDIEKRIPVENDSADLVISNCVINLTTNKVDAFKEVHRVLKRGGRMVISDLVADAEVAPDIANAEKWCSCIDGALTKENYLDSIRKAGFQNVEVLSERLYILEGKQVDGRKITSVVIEAVKE
jgi:arsenite methyltransferase